MIFNRFCIRFICPNNLKMHRTVSTVKGPYNYVNGLKVSPGSPTRTVSVNQPAKGLKLFDMPCTGASDVDHAVQCAKKAFETWSCLSAIERGRCLIDAASKIRSRLEEIAQLEVLDTGKPIWEARVDVSGCADSFQYFGGIATTVHGTHHVLANGAFSQVQREPLGVVAGIGAWNYPFQVMTWKVAPALACGNTFVFKPSQLTPLSAIVLAEILSDSGVPAGVVNVVQGEGETGVALCQHPDVSKVTFTGSVPTGQAILRSSADTLKKVTLELGGKSPLIIFDDCNLDDAVKATMLGNFLTQGEVCSNCTRVYCQQTIAQRFLDKLKAATERMKIGNPEDDETTVGATISEEHARKVLQYIESAKSEGAVVVTGGERVTLSDPALQGGFYLSPCILTNCHEKMKVVREEIFGAVLTLMTFETEEEAVARANQTTFGLAAGVMTRNLQRAHRVSSQLKAGTVWVNNYNVYPPEVPFGGYKMSGIGRENGLVSLDEFTQLKTVYFEMQENIECPIYKE